MLQRIESQPFKAVLIGEESLLIACGNKLQERGCTIAAVVSEDTAIREWATEKEIPLETMTDGLETRLASVDFDWLFSIANLKLIPDTLLGLAQRGAINFHDGPLPRYAGINAPVWALINAEKTYGVTWHMIKGGIDEGDIVAQRLFPVSEDDTAYSLNAKCYAAALDSFSDLLSQLISGMLEPVPQDLSQRSYFGRDRRPEAGGRLDFRQTAEELVALVRALDHGGYWNPLCRAKIELTDQVVLVGAAELAELDEPSLPGTVLKADPNGMIVATAQGGLRLTNLTDIDGHPVDGSNTATEGDVLEWPDDEKAAVLSDTVSVAAKGDAHWRRQLQDFNSLTLPASNIADQPGGTLHLAVAVPPSLNGPRLVAAIATWALRSAGVDRADLAFRGPETAELAQRAPLDVNGWVPLRISAGVQGAGMTSFDAVVDSVAGQFAQIREYPCFLSDLAFRDPGISVFRTPDIGLNACEGVHLPGTALTVALGDGQIILIGDAGRIEQPFFHILAERLDQLVGSLADGSYDKAPIDALPLMPPAERSLVVNGLNRTSISYDRSLTLHGAIEAQASRAPDNVALVFEDRELTFDGLNARANRVAHVLRQMGVGPGSLIGIYTSRGPDMVIGALAAMKAGGAYVPLDPSYPKERTSHCIADSGATVILTEDAFAAGLPKHEAALLVIDRDPSIAGAPDENPGGGAGGDDLAYLIYTSGSTGLPKGVPVRHRNVANFMAGMDDCIGDPDDGVWLALTSLSFDISVLELFYTLAKGYKVVLSGDSDRALVSHAPIRGSDRNIDFSLFYWGNDDGVGPKKYELLLEGAKFADAHGFCAVWTPERHFHAFGGPYPNPSVTGAAVAAVTQNIAVRAGSCVAPLHHPARIAEEWAVIDNLTNGRAGLAIASGWQPDDFVLRPENTPPENKTAMFTAIEQLRRLWRGEAVEFPTKSGTPHAVVTQPRPVSDDLALWVTTAGNPDTWKEAGSIGANVLTHLLGQSIDEVRDKIVLYHQALRDAGHDPADHCVTVMLHTLVGEDREDVRRRARGPMKDYLRSAAGLIKQYAWAFPAFKKPAGVSNPFQIDLGSLPETEMEAILDFAFDRYFEESGLFGTVDDCVARVDQLKAIGVDEVACLIDYGVETSQVMQSLEALATVLENANLGTQLQDDDFSIAAQIHRHGVTHLQATPSLARMLVTNDAARAALARVNNLMIGGEAMPRALARDLRAATPARILNMYGPTETTIWSTVAEVNEGDSNVSIGRPIANTRTYVLDHSGNPVPVGITGELCIGGDGVSAGYWQREDLTAERFPLDPFANSSGSTEPALMYRTGDLARWRPDGQLEFLGRADTQIKLRGHRIELGEIESALVALPGVTEAVAVAHTSADQDVRLLAYVTCKGKLDGSELRHALETRLPAHMLPSQIVVLDVFPKTPNKKVDRKAIAAIPPVRPRTSDRTVTKGTATEETIAAIWERVLGVNGIAPKDNFFALGGHSLLAVQVHRELAGSLGERTVSVTDIFAYPTLRGLAERLDARATPVSGECAQGSTRPTERDAAITGRRALRAKRQMETG